MPRDELDALLREHYSLIRAVCRRILHNDADADDATQNALIAVARGYSTFDGRSSVSTWIYRIATNAALDELRRRQRRQRVRLVDDVGKDLEIADPRTTESAAPFESKDMLDQALSRVPEEFRVPLILRDVADLEYEEISRILEIPPGTVRSRISRGRSRLASEWSRLDGNPDSSLRRPIVEVDDDPRRPR